MVWGTWSWGSGLGPGQKFAANTRQTKTRNKWPKKLQLRTATGAYINNETFSHTCRNFPGKMSHYAEQVAALNTFPTCHSTFPSAPDFSLELFGCKHYGKSYISYLRNYHRCTMQSCKAGGSGDLNGYETQLISKCKPTNILLYKLHQSYMFKIDLKGLFVDTSFRCQSPQQNFVH